MFTNQTKRSIIKGVLTKNSPFYIQFYISKYCHQKCGMCNIVEANVDVDPFGHDKIEKIAENLQKIGAGLILLTGGEPFMRPDIPDIVKIFKSRNLDVRSQTAGLVSKKNRVKEAMENGLRDISVSVDSLDEKKSDWINGLKDSWMNAIDMISFISRNFPDKDNICSLGAVLSKHNIKEILPLLDFCTEIGWWLSLVPVHSAAGDDAQLNFRGREDSMFNTKIKRDYGYDFQKDDFDDIKDLISILKEKKRNGSLLFDSDKFLDSVEVFLTTGHPNWRKNNVCDSPNLYFAILPDGKFAPCCDFRHSEDIYVYDDDFPEIFKSKQFKRDVKNIVEKCPGCNYGSFPVITLFARSFSSLIEKISVAKKSKSTGMISLELDEMLKIIKKIKNNYPEIYPIDHSNGYYQF